MIATDNVMLEREKNKKISLFVVEKFAKNLSLIEIFPEVYFIENVTIVLVRAI